MRPSLPTLVVGVLVVGAILGTRSGSPSPAVRSVTPRATAGTERVVPAIAVPDAPITPPTAAHTAEVVRPPAPTFATGNARLDALLATLPPVLFESGARVQFGYNPVDCCHAGGYNPGPNEVWISERALTDTARLTYVTAHELGHGLHLHSPRGPALTNAVAGAPVVAPGSPWDVSEKAADCVAWVLYPTETAASGITYWNCPDPWRAQVRAALE